VSRPLKIKALWYFETSYPRTLASSKIWLRNYRHCWYKVIFKRVCVTIVTLERKKYYALSVFVALVIQHSKRKCRIILSSVASLSLPNFPHYEISGRITAKKKKVIELKTCFDFPYNFCLKHFSFWKIIQLDIITDMHRTSCKMPGILARF
jgi:hypothetical protein